MKKYLRISQEILYSIIKLLVVVQIGLGAVWVVCNLGSLQNYGETEELLEIASTLVTDEYVGIFYPLLLKMVTAIESIIPIPYYCYLYVLQLAIGFLALNRLAESLRLPHRLWAVLGIMTIPTVLPLYLAVLPQALAVSMLILCLDGCFRGQWVRAAVCMAAGALFIPEYLWFGAAVYLCLLLAAFLKKRRIKGKRQELGKAILWLLLAVLAVGATQQVTITEYSQGRMKRTFMGTMMHRMVWPNLANTSYFWDAEIREAFSDAQLEAIAVTPEGMLYEFGPVIEEKYGQERAQELYTTMAMNVLKVRTRETLGNIAGDLLQYSVPQLVLLGSLKGEWISYSGWNYKCMSEASPEVSRLVVQYGCRVSWVLFLLSAAVALLDRRLCVTRHRTGSGSLTTGYVLAVLLQIVWYTMSASGMQDYKNVLLVSMGWGIWSACNIRCINGKDKVTDSSAV